MVSLPKTYEWLCHSNFSFLTGAAHPEEYVIQAAALGYQGIGLCDYDGVYGIVRAYRAWQQQQQTTRHTLERIFYGSEIHLQRDHQYPVVFQDTLVFYALSLAGYHNLCRILTASHRESKSQSQISLAELLSMDLNDLVCLIPMRGRIRRQNTPEVKRHWQLLKEVMPGRVYPVVSRHMNPSEDCWIRPTLQLIRQLDLPHLVSQDCYFHQPGNKDLCDLLQAIRLNKTVDMASSHMFVNSERCLLPADRFHRRYGSIPGYESALRHGHDLAERFQFDLHELRYRYPQEMIPDGMTSQMYLEAIAWRRAKEIYGESLSVRVKSLLTNELRLVATLQFADYFLTVWDIVRWARHQGILCQGRGSAANSAICFVLGITAVDPERFDLLFERFLSLERGDPPDIDVDFEHERREEVIQYIYEHYGRGRAAMVANVITYRSRGAIRAVGKALGVREDLLSEASELQGVRAYRHDSSTCLQALDAGETSDQGVPWQLWNDMANRLKGYPRHMGIHSGGFVLTHDCIEHLTPQEPATMVGRTVLQWSKDDIEALGIFKIDILALGMLTAVRKAFAMIRACYNVEMSMAALPQDDPETYGMIQQANTVGTFQIESRAQMSMLPRMRPEKFYDLVVQVGIIRPGPIQGGLIHPFLRRRHGLEPVTYAHPSLVPILERTMGVPIFQEQVMRVAMAVGGFSPGEADSLRKQIGSWSLNKNLGPLVQRLEQGMRAKGIPEAFVTQILGHLKGFADYGFPESHAVSFALVSYASSWLKCHYPAAFFAALLNSQPMGFYAPHALLQAAKRDGVVVLPICVNSSQWQASLEEYGEDQRGRQAFAIRLGFHMIKGLRREGVAALLALRQKRGPWQSLAEFLGEQPLFKGDLTALATSTALEVFGLERRAALWLAEAAPFAPLLEEDGLAHTFALEDPLVRAERDFESFGTTMGDHPVTIIKNHHWCFSVPLTKVVKSSELPHCPNNLILKAFGMVLVRQAPPTAKGMVFFTLEDEAGFVNLAFTPQVYEVYHQDIHSMGFLLVEGHLQKQGDSHSLLVKKVFRPLVARGEVYHVGAHSKPAAGAEAASTSKPERVHGGRRKLVKARNYM